MTTPDEYETLQQWAFQMEPVFTDDGESWTGSYPGADWSVSALTEAEARQKLGEEFIRRQNAGEDALALRRCRLSETSARARAGRIRDGQRRLPTAEGRAVDRTRPRVQGSRGEAGARPAVHHRRLFARSRKLARLNYFRCVVRPARSAVVPAQPLRDRDAPPVCRRDRPRPACFLLPLRRPA